MRIAYLAGNFKADPNSQRISTVKTRHSCNFRKACHALWIVLVEGQTMTHAGIVLGLNVGTISHIIHGRRFPTAYPVQPSL